MFRIFILTDKKYVNDSFPSNNFFQVQIPCLVKMSWSIKHFNQRRVKAILDAFFKNSNARVKTSWMYVPLRLCSMLVIDSYVWLQIFRFRAEKYRSHSSINAQFLWRKTFATFSTRFSLEPLRMLKIFVRQSSLIVSSTAFCVIQPSFWTSLPSMR